MKTKALALFSGGLDSQLAVKVIQDQDIEVEGLHFILPTCKASLPGDATKDKILRMGQQLGIEVKLVELQDEFLEMLKKPKHGYGRNLNPCIDCKIMMLNWARNYMQQTGAAFVVTGAVVGQRPMSQHRKAMVTLERESGLEGLIVNPLSARLLPVTIPEQQGLLDRDKLLSISGRSRNVQLELAEKYGITEHYAPAGGCALTEPNYAKKLRDAMAHSEITVDNIKILNVGRHLRLTKQAKLIVGRNEKENDLLLMLCEEDDLKFYPDEETAGPTAIGEGLYDEDLIAKAAAIVARYCDGPLTTEYSIFVEQHGDERCLQSVMSMPAEEVDKYRIV